MCILYCDNAIWMDREINSPINLTQLLKSTNMGIFLFCPQTKRDLNYKVNTFTTLSC